MIALLLSRVARPRPSERAKAMKSVDIAIISDFRFPGGTSSCIAAELKVLRDHGYTVGLIPIKAGVLKQRRPINPLIRAHIDGRQVQLITDHRQTVDARLAVFHNPLAFKEFTAPKVRLRAEMSLMAAHQPADDAHGIPFYECPQVTEVVESFFGLPITWAPISPVVRQSLDRFDGEIQLWDHDWSNIIDLNDWTSSDRQRPAVDRIVIGRHSRPDRLKWPSSRAEMLKLYPEAPDIDVRFLGTPDDLHELVGEIPENWTLYRFNQVQPVDFLKTIDFFVYYHHPTWVEAFGRTIAEAIASGVIAIVPPYFEAMFGESALYASVDEVEPLVRDLHADRERYAATVDQARRFLARNYGPGALVERIQRVLGRPHDGPALTLVQTDGAASARSAVPPQEEPEEAGETCDVLLMGDMRMSEEGAAMVAEAVRLQHAAGLRTLLLHTPGEKPAAPREMAQVHPVIAGLVTEGVATVVTTDRDIHARLVLGCGPWTLLTTFSELLPAITADAFALLADRSPPSDTDVVQVHRRLKAILRCEPVWAPSDGSVRAALVKAWPEIPLTDGDWVPSLQFGAWRDPARRYDFPTIGLVFAGERDPEKPMLELADVISRSGRQVLWRVWDETGRTVNKLGKEGSVLAQADVFRKGEASLDRFLRNLDFLVIGPTHPSDWVIGKAMAAGVVPLLLGSRPGYGSEVMKVGVKSVVKTAQALYADDEAHLERARLAGRTARSSFAPQHHLDRLSRVGIEPSGGTPPAAGGRPSRRKRVLFLSSNGVGLGHLTRLLAVARRVDDSVDPVFATMSQAFGIVREFGFPVEYIPYSSASESDPLLWNTWFEQHLAEVVDFYGATGIVFDGGAPYGGMLRALATRPDLFMMWIRRGMWRSLQHNEPLIARQKFFDLIVEPGDVAETRDSGATANYRNRVVPVDPIRLLDESELLPRAEARKQLGFDGRETVGLIQLGAGANREIARLTDRVVAACNSQGIKPVVAEWAIGSGPSLVPPGAVALRGFPLSRWFNAFDFTVSAVGYNSFNEIISFGLPGIFLPNTNPIMDDQEGRSDFAQDHGACFSLRDEEIAGLETVLEAMKDSRTQSLLRANSARIAKPNGAQAAADLVAEMADRWSAVRPQEAAADLVRAAE